jgi:hypothetical protein
MHDSVSPQDGCPSRLSGQPGFPSPGSSPADRGRNCARLPGRHVDGLWRTQEYAGGAAAAANLSSIILPNGSRQAERPGAHLAVGYRGQRSEGRSAMQYRRGFRWCQCQQARQQKVIKRINPCRPGVVLQGFEIIQKYDNLAKRVLACAAVSIVILLKDQRLP